MIRIICCKANAGMAANVGGPVKTDYVSFDVDLPEVEKWLQEREDKVYEDRHFVGVEIRAAAQQTKDEIK